MDDSKALVASGNRASSLLFQVKQEEADYCGRDMLDGKSIYRLSNLYGGERKQQT